jgi:hypothetical protein
MMAMLRIGRCMVEEAGKKGREITSSGCEMPAGSGFSGFHDTCVAVP